jgi:hypothetical protein
MKTLRRLVAVGLLIGSYSVGMAQSNSVPEFNSEAEKQAWLNANDNAASPQFQSDEDKSAWIQANPEKYEALKGDGTSTVTVTAKPAVGIERVRTANTDEGVVLPANTTKAATQISGATSVQRPVSVRVNNTLKALPADYKASYNETKPNK